MKKILIIGGTSAIATATAINFAKNGDELFLADINISRLQEVQKHIQALTDSNVSIAEFSLKDDNVYHDVFNTAIKKMGEVDAVLIAYGTLPEQEKIKNDISAVIEQININFTSVISFATVAAEYFEKRDTGCIAAISSVAGDRGRQSNYIYGAAKGAISLYLQGLRNRFGKTDISVLTIKPGFVDTPMTANMPKNFLYSSPETIGKIIYDAMNKGKDVVYAPGFWRYIMMIIKIIPEGIFKKLSL